MTDNPITQHWESMAQPVVHPEDLKTEAPDNDETSLVKDAAIITQ